MTAPAKVAVRVTDPDVIVRTLTSLDDCNACVELQRHVWGYGDGDITPASLLHVVEYVGGIAAGAFDAQGTLLGFVFGISGIHDGELAHWSHMLGVRESARNMGVGRMLKEHQRRTMAELNVKRIFWTFDPLMAKNAYFNFNRLGARIIDYVPDMYGTTGSPLHYGLATDRLVVCIETAENRSAPWILSQDERHPVLTAFPRPNDVTLSLGDQRPKVVLLEIPNDVLDVMARTPAQARTWRFSVRENFEWALRNRYVARGVHRDAKTGRCFYIEVLDPSTDVPDAR
ncbi:MAG: hypothetical protein M3081_09090 [Gemmatimonadota bacterium]|nr:hypothetical protein [Gemmatimonadota bacterium]